jgi:hypothetical protein
MVNGRISVLPAVHMQMDGGVTDPTMLARHAGSRFCRRTPWTFILTKNGIALRRRED